MASVPSPEYSPDYSPAGEPTVPNELPTLPDDIDDPSPMQQPDTLSDMMTARAMCWSTPQMQAEAQSSPTRRLPETGRVLELTH